MKIALAQMKMDTDIEKNFQKSLQLICEAAEKKADIQSIDYSWGEINFEYRQLIGEFSK